MHPGVTHSSDAEDLGYTGQQVMTIVTMHRRENAERWLQRE